jgi:anthranilate phosphoribosyltransferase
MIKEAIGKLADRRDLTKSEAFQSMNDIMSGETSDSVIAAFLMGLRSKGETVGEIAGCALAMRDHAVRITTKRQNVIDTCGTGGDGSGTFNISSTAALIASAGGASVAKHGNRGVSSACGSADVLSALGVKIDVPPEKAEKVLDELGITFLFAPIMHGAMKYAGNVRKQLGMRTVFNILGPLTNPAGARRQVIGVFRPELTEVMAGVLAEMNAEHAMVVHGEGGLDEFSILGKTRISELKDGSIHTFEVNSSDFGFHPAQIRDVQGGSVEDNVGIVRGILDGKTGAPTEIAVFNAGAALYVSSVAASLNDGISLAQDVVRDGRAKKKLSDWIEATNS